MDIFIGLLVLGGVCFFIFKDINNNKVIRTKKTKPELHKTTLSSSVEPLTQIIRDTRNSEQFRNNISSKLNFLKEHYSSGGTGYRCSNKNENATTSQKGLLSELGLVKIPNKLTAGQASDLISSNLRAKGEYYSDWKDRLAPYNKYNMLLEFQMDYIILEAQVESSLVDWYGYEHCPLQYTQDPNDKLTSYQKNSAIFWGLELNDLSIIQGFKVINETLQNAPEYKQKLFKAFIRLEHEVSDEYKKLTGKKRFYAKKYAEMFRKKIIEKDIKTCPNAKALAALM